MRNSTIGLLIILSVVIAIPNVVFAQYGGSGGVGLFIGDVPVKPAQSPPAGGLPRVLGATTCSLYLTNYLGRRDSKNNVNDVKKLQDFLNSDLGLALNVNGIYNTATIGAVKQFQLKYPEQVLSPWVNYGFLKPNVSTGIVYKTTLRMINMLACPGSELPLPQLP